MLEFIVLSSDIAVDLEDLLRTEVEILLSELGRGVTLGTAYDTAWGARLACVYPHMGFDAALDWLRRHQHEDGTWGAPLVHNHDRFISTLAAIVALQEGGRHPRDKRRIRRGENALWRLIGRLGRDDSDTVGFPILAAALADEATALGLDVPCAPVRYAKAYKRKVESLLQDNGRDWLSTTLTFSFEALRTAAGADDQVTELNGSVSVSPSATAAYLMTRRDDRALLYMQSVTDLEGSGAVPAVIPIDMFEIAWSLTHLYSAGAVDMADAQIRPLLQFLWSAWSPERGVSSSSQWSVPEIDDTAACLTVLSLGGYPVSESVFDVYEMDEFFWCYVGETNPSLSAHVRLLSALRTLRPSARSEARIRKVVGVLYRLDENGSFWHDKWHASPYYVSSFAVNALQGIADDLSYSRFKWILRTQNDDGGWGYLGRSTPEETAYCLQALLRAKCVLENGDRSRVDAAARYLQSHLGDRTYVPLWIGKSLYTPYYPVKAAILAALHEYVQRSN
jgi:halimadienyl-diphosphate synthase